MPPKRSTRAAAQARSTGATTTTAARAAAADAAPAPKTVLARRTKPTARAAPSTKKTARRPQTDGANDDDDDDDDEQQQQNNGSGSEDSGDDSDSLAISTRPARLYRNRMREQQAGPEEYVMTGGLGEGEVAKTGAGRTVRTKKKKVKKADEGQARALEALKRRREEAMRGGAAAGDKAEDEDGAAAAAVAAAATRGRRRESSLPPQVPGTVNRVRRASSSHWNPPPSAVKAQGTPGAGETSVLALSMFKRRKRQPSLLRMMQQSDVEDGGEGSEDESALTLDYSLGDFEPDHESTPLNLKKGPAARGSEPRTSSSRKRKLADRELEEVQVPRSSPPVEEEADRSGVKATSSEHLYSEPSDLPQVIADTQPEPEEVDGETADDPVVLSETREPSRSSTSPPSSLPVVPDPEEEAPAKRPRRSVRDSTTSNINRTTRQTPRNVEEDHAADPLSSSDSDSDTATETPVRARSTTTRKKGSGRKPKAMTLSTATLQSLLPRRRKKAAPPRKARNVAATFEIPSSDVEDEDVEEESVDEDELHRAPPARKGRRPAAASGVAKASDSTVRGEGKRLSRTYGRKQQRLSSDKENQDADASMYVRSDGESDGDGGGDEDDVVETSEMRKAATKKSKELEAAARKFREVDQWEMEFESVDMGGASASSPWR